MPSVRSPSTRGERPSLRPDRVRRLQCTAVPQPCPRPRARALRSTCKNFCAALLAAAAAAAGRRSRSSSRRPGAATPHRPFAARACSITARTGASPPQSCIRSSSAAAIYSPSSLHSRWRPCRASPHRLLRYLGSSHDGRRVGMARPPLRGLAARTVCVPSLARRAPSHRSSRCVRSPRRAICPLWTLRPQRRHPATRAAAAAAAAVATSQRTARHAARWSSPG